MSQDPCGSINDQNQNAQLINARTCIHDAFALCTPAKMYRIIVEGNQQFESFVEVRPTQDATCSIYVSIISNIDALNVGQVAKSCTTLDPNEDPETACDIGNL